MPSINALGVIALVQVYLVLHVAKTFMDTIAQDYICFLKRFQLLSLVMAQIISIGNVYSALIRKTMRML